MARRITGSDFAYQIIEDIDHSLKRQRYTEITEDDALGSQSTQLQPRTCQNFNDREPDDLSHLKPSTPLSDPTFSPDALGERVSSEAIAPRPKLIMMDYAWRLQDRDSPDDTLVMPQKVAFLTPECRDLNELRNSNWGDLSATGDRPEPKPNNLLYREHRGRPMTGLGGSDKDNHSQKVRHGEAMVGAVRFASAHRLQKEIIKRENNVCRRHRKEWALWNLAPRADIILLTVREVGFVKPESYDHVFRNLQESGEVQKERANFYRHSPLLALLNKMILGGQTEHDPIRGRPIQDIFHLSNKIMSDLKGAIIDRFVKENLADDTYVAQIAEQYIDYWVNRKFPHNETLEDFEWTIELVQSLVASFIEDIAIWFSYIAEALEEAGLAETFRLLREVGHQTDGSVGVGDTLVCPIELDLTTPETDRDLETKLNKDSSNIFEKFLKRHEARQAKIGRVLSMRRGHDGDQMAKPSGLILPIIALTRVEDEVRRVTCDHKISVVISAGNAHFNLDWVDLRGLNQILPTPRPNASREKISGAYMALERDTFHARAVSCGAIIVGSAPVSLAKYWIDPLSKRFGSAHNDARVKAANEHVENLKESLSGGDRDSHLSDFANFGVCVNAFGRGEITEIEKRSDDDPSVFEIESSVYEHWRGASIASVITACCIANIQHIRMLCDFIRYLPNVPTTPIGPYRPFEARAHIEVFRSLECWQYDCVADLMGPPTDIEAWLQGTHMSDFIANYGPDYLASLSSMREP